MNKIWSDEAWDDYMYWHTQDRKTVNRINRLIKSIDRNNFRTCLHKTGVRICGKILSMARQKSAGILAYFKDF